MTTPTIDDIVGRYVQLRDLVKAKTDAFDESLKPFKHAMEQLEGVVLGKLNEQGVDSFKTPHGTAYKTETMSMKTVSKDELLRHVIATEQWSLLDVRPLKESVKEFIENEQTPPPGVEVAYITKVNFRRS